jgi:hypothetical protein
MRRSEGWYHFGMCLQGLKGAMKHLNMCNRLLGKNSGTISSRPVLSDSFTILKVNLYFHALFYEVHDMKEKSCLSRNILTKINKDILKKLSFGWI